MKVKIEIDTKTFIRFWLVVIGFVLAALLVYSARVALTIIAVAFFLAIILSPSVNLLARFLPNRNRVLSTAIAYTAVVLFLGVVVFLVIPPIVDQTVKFAQNVPSLVDSASQRSAGITRFIKQYNLQPEVDRIFVSIRYSADNFVSGVGTSLLSGIGSVLSIITATILVIVLTFLMLVEGPTWVNRLWKLYRDKEHMKRHRLLLEKMYKVINNYAIGQLTVSAIDGFISGLAVFVLSLVLTVPSGLAITTAVVMFLSSLVPLFGAMVGAIFISLMLALDNITVAIIFLIFVILYQQVEANFISPKIQSKRNDLSVLTVLIAVTVGIYLFGIVGGIVSIPVAGCIKVLVDNRLSRTGRVKE